MFPHRRSAPTPMSYQHPPPVFVTTPDTFTAAAVDQYTPTFGNQNHFVVHEALDATLAQPYVQASPSASAPAFAWDDLSSFVQEKAAPHENNFLFDGTPSSLPMHPTPFLSTPERNASNTSVDDSGYQGAAPKSPRKSKSVRSAVSFARIQKPTISRSRSRASSNSFPCPQCNRVFQNASELEKDRLRHVKPFRCGEHDCKRTDGFPTKNDLERHRKAVHALTPRLGDIRGFLCSECPEPPPNNHKKFWPRKDNFAAHIRRKHKDRDVQDVITKSQAPPPRTTSEPCQESRMVVSEYGEEAACNPGLLIHSDAPSHFEEQLFDTNLQSDEFAHLGVGTTTLDPNSFGQFGFGAMNTGEPPPDNLSTTDFALYAQHLDMDNISPTTVLNYDAGSGHMYQFSQAQYQYTWPSG